MTTATRRWAKTEATQQRILDAATEVFAARGFTATTMTDIVDHHFGGKELFLAIFERLAADIDRHIDAAADKSGELGPRWCWLPVTPRPASTGSAATACSGDSGAGCRCSSSTPRRVVSY
jgi:AcrR family transcriptional regulator